jgi:hypothetical protein
MWLLKCCTPRQSQRRTLQFINCVCGLKYTPMAPTRTGDGYWTIKTNQEINDTLKGQNIIWFIKKTKTKLFRPC